MSASDLTKLPPTNGTDTTVIRETPRGSRSKYDYDPGVSAIRLAALLPEGSVFPFDFGFIPSTLAEDGDPVDVMVLMEEPAFPGCIISARIVGAIKAEQRKAGEQRTRNDRLIGVATHSHTHSHIRSIKQISGRVLDEIEAFFHHYNRLKGGRFRALGRVGSKKAALLVESAISRGTKNSPS